MHQAIPGNGPMSGTTGNREHSKDTQGQESTTDDERGRHTPVSDTAKAQGQYGTSGLQQT
jgi:hypothetical protein